MPSFSPGLDDAIRKALALAHDQRYATLEHLLLALTDDGDARDVLLACNCNVPLLQTILEIEFALRPERRAPGETTQPTAAFQRVIQRAIIHAQSSGREKVTGANVIVTMFAERNSRAAVLLEEQNITRYDVVNYISHGLRKRPPDLGWDSPL